MMSSNTWRRIVGAIAGSLAFIASNQLLSSRSTYKLVRAAAAIAPRSTTVF